MKVILNYLFLLGLFFILPIQTAAQQCRTSEIRKNNIGKNPLIIDEIKRINTFTDAWIKENTLLSSTRSIVTLPIVIHVIWKNSAQNISDAQILTQIEVLNDDFRKKNSNFSDTPSGFRPIAADVEIEFCLASFDPSGNPTTGITRTQTQVNGIGNSELFYKTSSGGINAWDISKYINIWVCDLGDDGLLGFATPPGTAEPANSDGLVIGYQFFGTIGTAANSFPNDLGRTVTHEMGHYLNLEHLWGPDQGGCDEDDFVSDTPLQDWESEECPNFPFFDDCSFSGIGINFNNYMDYTDDECMTMFTMGQKLRMHAALNGPRASLLNSNACSLSSSSADYIMEASTSILKTFPNPAKDFLNIEILENILIDKNIITIIDINGKTIISEKMQQKMKIDVSKLNPGIYFLGINNKALHKVIILE